MLPSAVCAAHLEASPNLPGQWPVLRLCCYGPVSAVVTTVHGQPIVLTTSALRTPPVGHTEKHVCAFTIIDASHGFPPNFLKTSFTHSLFYAVMITIY